MTADRPAHRISLVLGSGGARGMAHIGVIDALTEAGCEIDAISGCSMGALVGGIHAMGRLDEYRHWLLALERLDVLRLLDISFSSSGLIKGERIIRTLKALTGDTRIEDLPIRFTAVATDLGSGREVWIDEGPLYDAIRASIAVPTFFTPLRRQGRLLVDGGLCNPVPIAPTMRRAADLRVAVDLNGPPEPGLGARREEERREREQRSRNHEAILKFIEEIGEKLVGNREKRARSEEEPGALDVMNRAYEIMQSQVTNLKLAAYGADVLIRIPRNLCLTYEFYRAEEVIAFGLERAEQALAAARTSER